MDDVDGEDSLAICDPWKHASLPVEPMHVHVTNGLIDNAWTQYSKSGDAQAIVHVDDSKSGEEEEEEKEEVEEHSDEDEEDDVKEEEHHEDRQVAIEHQQGEEAVIKDDKQEVDELPHDGEECFSRACARPADIRRDDRKCCGTCIGYQFRGSHSKESNRWHPDHIIIR